MLRPVGAIARYAMCGGAGAAAYDCATNDGSMLSQVIHQLVASASSGRAAGALASTADFGGSAVQRLELAELSAKLDRLASLAVWGFGTSRGARVPLGALLCAAGAIVGGLAVWAVATGRWWPTIQAKLESVEQAIGLVDAKVDARALELAAQLREQHAAILSAVGAMHASVRETDDKVCQLERRIEQIDETGKENNSGGRSRTLAPPCASRARRAAPAPLPLTPRQTARLCAIATGIKILCEVVATNFDLRQCPAPVLKRLHAYSGTGGELVQSRSPARALQPAPAQVARHSSPTLMEYLTSPSYDHNPAAC